MITTEQINSLSPKESVVVLEALWRKMTQLQITESPSWHQAELEEIDQSLSDGSASFSDWTIARQKIRDRVK
jgi:Putative addiction module component